MILPIPILADLAQIRERRQALIDQNAVRENQRRRFVDYAIGDQVLKLADANRKLDPRALGPFTVTTVHTNGNLTIELENNLYERINIRRVKPFKA